MKIDSIGPIIVVSRRKALGSFAGIGLMGMGVGWSNSRGLESVPVIEWNAHMFSSDTTSYPIHPEATYVPDLSTRPADPLVAYLGHLEAEKIDRAVIVHPEPYGDDHLLIIDCLKRKPNILRGTSLFYPKDPDAPKKLETLVKRVPHIVSTRFHAHRGKENYFDSFLDEGPKAL